MLVTWLIKGIAHVQDDYDHSYFFISTFMDDHIAHHAKALKAAS